LAMAIAVGLRFMILRHRESTSASSWSFGTDETHRRRLMRWYSGGTCTRFARPLPRRGGATHTRFVVDVAKTYERLKSKAAKRAAARAR
jgi:hypothetical protein